MRWALLTALLLPRAAGSKRRCPRPCWLSEVWTGRGIKTLQRMRWALLAVLLLPCAAGSERYLLAGDLREQFAHGGRNLLAFLAIARELNRTAVIPHMHGVSASMYQLFPEIALNGSHAVHGVPAEALLDWPLLSARCFAGQLATLPYAAWKARTAGVVELALFVDYAAAGVRQASRGDGSPLRAQRGVEVRRCELCPADEVRELDILSGKSAMRAGPGSEGDGGCAYYPFARAVARHVRIGRLLCAPGDFLLAHGLALNHKLMAVPAGTLHRPEREGGRRPRERRRSSGAGLRDARSHAAAARRLATSPVNPATGSRPDGWAARSSPAGGQSAWRRGLSSAPPDLEGGGWRSADRFGLLAGSDATSVLLLNFGGVGRAAGKEGSAERRLQWAASSSHLASLLKPARLAECVRPRAALLAAAERVAGAQGVDGGRGANAGAGFVSLQIRAEKMHGMRLSPHGEQIPPRAPTGIERGIGVGIRRDRGIGGSNEAVRSERGRAASAHTGSGGEDEGGVAKRRAAKREERRARRRRDGGPALQAEAQGMRRLLGAKTVEGHSATHAASRALALAPAAPAWPLPSASRRAHAARRGEQRGADGEGARADRGGGPVNVRCLDGAVRLAVDLAGRLARSPEAAGAEHAVGAARPTDLSARAGGVGGGSRAVLVFSDAHSLGSSSYTDAGHRQAIGGALAAALRRTSGLARLFDCASALRALGGSLEGGAGGAHAPPAPEACAAAAAAPDGLGAAAGACKVWCLLLELATMAAGDGLVRVGPGSFGKYAEQLFGAVRAERGGNAEGSGKGSSVAARGAERGGEPRWRVAIKRSCAASDPVRLRLSGGSSEHVAASTERVAASTWFHYDNDAADKPGGRH